MTNCRSKIDDTNLCKIYILALLAVCIGAIMFFRSGGGEDFFQRRGKTSFLAWKESQLILTSAGDKEITEENTALPVNLRPIFFRPIPFNDAGYDLLLTIPGVGPKTAVEMLEKRSELGKFDRAEELVVIRGIGAKKAVFLKEYLTFE